MIRLGLEFLLEKKFHLIQDKKIGILCHPASIDSKYRNIVQLVSEKSKEIVCLFSPQHGFHGEKQDNMIESTNFRHPSKGIPVYSLYSQVRKPTKSMLAGIDLLIVDLQDIGSRVYTYISTLTHCLEACEENQKEVLVLDRPNPIGGVQVEGNVLDTALKSFVGVHPLPMRHGMTLGEMALFLHKELGFTHALQIIPMQGYRRAMDFPKTGLSWVQPSPNIPTVDSAYAYAGTVLFEGTNLSEGRGTTRPFEIVGAPFIDPYLLKEKLDRFHFSLTPLDGVIFRPVYFEPTFHKFQGKICGGVQIHRTNSEQFRPYRVALAILQSVQELYPNQLAFRDPPYEYEHKKKPIDLLIGDSSVRKNLFSLKLEELEESWKTELKLFLEKRKQYLLYS